MPQKIENFLNLEKIYKKKLIFGTKIEREKKLILKNIQVFLIKIGYLKKEGKKFQIETKNVDSEISSIAGPQLVVSSNECKVFFERC